MEIPQNGKKNQEELLKQKWKIYIRSIIIFNSDEIALC